MTKSPGRYYREAWSPEVYMWHTLEGLVTCMMKPKLSENNGRRPRILPSRDGVTPGIDS